jgi:hypothetical protein
MEMTTEEKNPQNEFFGNKKAIFVILGIVLVLVIAYGLLYTFVVVPKQRMVDSAANYYRSLLKNDPTPLQNALIADIKDGRNDKYTKSDAYFITHRFFDNGGNIYEIYDYINAHPELAFLKEAESMYPKIFAQIKNRTLPSYFVDRALYACLAYIEVLYKNGYTDVAATATLANQYAKLAYFTTTIAKEMPAEEGAKRAAYAPRDAKKAVDFLRLAENDIVGILDGTITSDDVTPRDILVGLNQYGAAMRYLEVLGMASSSPLSSRDSREIFAYAIDFSHRHVPELRHFTALLNASTLALLPSGTSEETKIALYPILDLDLKSDKILETSVVHRVLDSRFEQKPQDVGDTLQDIYSKRNTLRLADKVPEFKNWLMANGWVETDFR